MLNSVNYVGVISINHFKYFNSIYFVSSRGISNLVNFLVKNNFRSQQYFKIVSIIAGELLAFISKIFA